ncbi:hypothetical protein PTSG_02006 [Salpingoeca rosetta]|uniref:UEV domain-containing protein n=1 Tax=Salpingoeca rosetta (strain ATCC 50818 / BSB-021) TaxID=946362 RepID=F2TZL4_SALR5|nr:uncharacterized protein PTSG_02006 [Salpingoeca rosetta]EGD79038.1 hypothetical protein PTSG_02006 [Salpingoeca rosetta]|eukprot:XP_004997994.1 hypothetical protein PTSG_02006 [Salpingoeca rosetta]
MRRRGRRRRRGTNNNSRARDDNQRQASKHREANRGRKEGRQVARTQLSKRRHTEAHTHTYTYIQAYILRHTMAQFLPCALETPLSLEEVTTASLYLYDQHDTVAQQLRPCVQQYPLIQPKVGQFMYPTGQNEYLVYLDGLLPMYYQGHEYSTPIKAWIQRGFPAEAPLVFVVPTPDLKVQPSPSYEVSGLVHDPYIDQWSAGSSHLYGLLEALSRKFGAEPPLRQVTSWTSAPSSTGTSSYTQPPPSSYAYTTPSQPQPPSTSPSTTYNPYAGPYAQPPQHHQQQQPLTGSSTGSVHGYGPGSLEHSTTSSVHKDDDEAMDRQLREVEERSLREFVSGEIIQRLKDMRQAKEIQLQDLQEDESALQLGQQQLEGYISSLRGEIMRAKQRVHELTKKEDDLDRAASGVDGDVEINWDEAVQPETPLERQLLELVADDSAITDVLDQLSTAFDDAKIDLSTYLKNVKQLAKEQFRIRSLIKKARAVGKFPSP